MPLDRSAFVALALMLGLSACSRPAPTKDQPIAPPSEPPAPAADACPLSHPANGSPERAAILDALRPTVEAMTGKPVEFVVSRLDVACDYARVVADPRAKTGTDQYETIDAMIVRKDGAWTLGLVAAAEEASPPPGEQYKAKYPDVAPELVN